MRSVSLLRPLPLLVALAGCGGPGAPPRAEDTARQAAPIPACVVHLPPRKASVAARALREEQYWKLVYPQHDIAAGRLPAGARACNGRNVLSDPVLEGGEAFRGGWPLKVEEGDIVFGAGGDRLKIVWLRSHRFPDGSAGGAIALVRTLEEYAEVYGVGTYRGRAEKTKLGIERIGGEVVVTAQNDGCTGHSMGQPCETTLYLYLPRKGRLVPLVELPLERVAFAMSSEPGALGPIEYHLTISPTYIPQGLKILEQVKVRDERLRALRKAELERVFLIDGEKVVPSDEPLWPRVYPASKKIDEGAKEVPKDAAPPPKDDKDAKDKGGKK